MKKLLGAIILFYFFVTNNLHADIVDQLNKLNDLYKAGVITKKEFTKGKSIILKVKEKNHKKKLLKKTKKKILILFLQIEVKLRLKMEYS